MTNIGFIGLGIMGRPMAGQLIRGGHALFLHSRRGVPQELLEQGGKACFSPKEVAQNADASLPCYLTLRMSSVYCSVKMA